MSMPEAAQSDQPQPLRVPFEFPAETYTQRVQIAFKTAEAAKKASVAITPLYNGYAWAISSRWDDNNESDLKMRDTLARHGHKGTFYLNRPDHWGDFVPTARKLLEGGNSIGGHSLTHPMLTWCNRNRIFEELAGIRAEWEAAADTHVLSYTFSFCRFRSEFEGVVAHADVDRLLERAGYYNVANLSYAKYIPVRMTISPIMPSDGAEIDEFAQAALNDKSFQQAHPNLSYSMHVWYETPEAWAKFESQLEKYGRNGDWWYCNQNQYAAYRYQFLYSKLSDPVREGNRLTFQITRPILLHLNDPTPVTFVVGGAQSGEVAEVKCATADAVLSERRTGGVLFHLWHDRDQTLPEKIGKVHNAENRSEPAACDSDADFPALKALLHFDDGRLSLLIDNQADQPLENLRITYRLPLAWRDGVVVRKLGDLAAGARSVDSIIPSRAIEDYKYNSGFSFFQAQIDFTRGGKAGRLYASCHFKNITIDRSYPQGGFARLGPIPAEKFDLAKLTHDAQTGALTAGPYKLADGTQLEWSFDDDPFAPPFLDPETVRTYGSFRCDESIYIVLASTVHSEIEQQVELIRSRKTVQNVFLNGAEVKDDKPKLAKGANDLVLVFRSRFGERRFSKFCPDHGGCFLRLASPGTSERLTNIRFEPAMPKGRLRLRACPPSRKKQGEQT